MQVTIVIGETNSSSSWDNDSERAVGARRRFIAKGDESLAAWDYKTAYVDFRGRISSEGVEFIRQQGEHRTSFVTRYLTALGQEGWEVAAVHPLIRTESSYFVLKRPATEAKSEG
jgi:hypothetical protein